MTDKLEILTLPKGYTYIIPIKGTLDEHETWAQAIEVTENATEADTLHFKINSGGGRADIMFDLVHAMEMCKAKIICEIVGECASAATIIFLNADEFIVNRYSDMMIHEAQIGAGGTSSNVKGHVNFSHQQTEKLVAEEYRFFLTDVEMERVLSGVEINLNADEIKERLDVRATAMDELAGIVEPPTEEVVRAMKHDQLLSFLYDGDYDESKWVDITNGFPPKDNSAPIGDYWVCPKGNLYLQGTDEVLLNVKNKPTQVDWSAKYLKIIAAGMGLQYNNNASHKVMVKLIISKLKEVVDTMK